MIAAFLVSKVLGNASCKEAVDCDMMAIPSARREGKHVEVRGGQLGGPRKGARGKGPRQRDAVQRGGKAGQAARPQARGAAAAYGDTTVPYVRPPPS
jgi:hypothetical protein